MRDLVSVFDQKLRQHGIKKIELAQLVGRTRGNLTQICNKSKGVPVETLELLINKAEEMCPGFEDDYYATLAGKFDMTTWVDTLSISEVSILLFLCSRRVAEIKPSKPRSSSSSEIEDERELIPA